MPHLRRRGAAIGVVVLSFDAHSWAGEGQSAMDVRAAEGLRAMLASKGTKHTQAPEGCRQTNGPPRPSLCNTPPRGDASAWRACSGRRVTCFRRAAAHRDGDATNGAAGGGLPAAETSGHAVDLRTAALFAARGVAGGWRAQMKRHARGAEQRL